MFAVVVGGTLTREEFIISVFTISYLILYKRNKYYMMVVPGFHCLARNEQKVTFIIPINFQTFLLWRHLYRAHEILLPDYAAVAPVWLPNWKIVFLLYSSTPACNPSFISIVHANSINIASRAMQDKTTVPALWSTQSPLDPRSLTPEHVVPYAPTTIPPTP